MAKAPNWNQEDIEYLKSVWEDMGVSIEDIVNRLNRRRQTISAKARKLGLSRGHNSVFSKEDVEILKEFYPHMTAYELQSQFFQDKTTEQISNAGYNHKIKKTDEYMHKIKVETAINNLNFITVKSGENHPNWVERITLYCENCGKEIIRTEARINDSNFCSVKCINENRIGKYIGENNPNWRGGYSTVKEYGRLCIKQWKVDSMRNCNYKCIITGGQFDDIHHIVSFDDIFFETIEELGFTELNNITYYSDEDILKFRNKLIENHYKYPLGVCITKEYHKLFHSIYGRGINTEENWNEFVNSFK